MSYSVKQFIQRYFFILEGQSTVIIERHLVHLFQLANYLEISQIKPKKITSANSLFVYPVR